MADLTTLLSAFLSNLYVTGGAVVAAQAPNSGTVPTGVSTVMVGTVRYTGTQRLTVQGTGRVRII